MALKDEGREIVAEIILEGTNSQTLLSYGSGSTKRMTMHLCSEGANTELSSDVLVHAVKVKKYKAAEAEGWEENLVNSRERRRVKGTSGRSLN